jgi:hypothetical protein
LRLKVASKSLQRKECNCAFENLSLRCGATNINLRTCGLALFSATCPPLGIGKVEVAVAAADPSSAVPGHPPPPPRASLLLLSPAPLVSLPGESRLDEEGQRHAHQVIFAEEDEFLHIAMGNIHQPGPAAALHSPVCWLSFFFDDKPHLFFSNYHTVGGGPECRRCIVIIVPMCM